jgi:hypothetical protein
MGIDADLEELRMFLIDRLDMEHYLNELQLVIAACEPNADAFVDPSKLIHCALYLEMRMGLKISTMISTEGMSGFLIKSEQVAFIERIENITNEDIFGSPESPSTWHFLSAEPKGVLGLLFMGDGHLPNTKVHRLIPKIDNIIDACIRDKTRKKRLRTVSTFIKMH